MKDARIAINDNATLVARSGAHETVVDIYAEVGYRSVVVCSFSINGTFEPMIRESVLYAVIGKKAIDEAIEHFKFMNHIE